MLFVSRTCFNEFLSLLDVAWVNKSIVLYCIVLYCIVLYCIVLYCITFDGQNWHRLYSTSAGGKDLSNDA